MPTISINRLVNANVYMDGDSLLGRVQDFDIPDPKAKMSEHKAIGMVGEMQFPSGLAKMEAKFKWSSFFPEIWRKTANPFKSHQLTVRGNLETYQGADRVSEVPVVITMRGSWMESGNQKFNQHDNVEKESTLNVLYIKCVIDGQEIYELDVPNNVFFADGVDQLATYRANLGI